MLKVIPEPWSPGVNKACPANFSGDDSWKYRQVGDYADLDEAMEAFNELINRRN